MKDIIEINIKSPWVKPNFDYISDVMIRTHCDAIVYNLNDYFALRRMLTRKGYNTLMTTVDKRRRKVVLRQEGEGSDGQVSEYTPKIEALKKGKKVEAVNRGQATYLTRLFNKEYPELKGQIGFVKTKEDTYVLKLG